MTSSHKTTTNINPIKRNLYNLIFLIHFEALVIYSQLFRVSSYAPVMQWPSMQAFQACHPGSNPGGGVPLHL